MQRGVHELHLGGLERPRPDAQIHRSRLHDPSGRLLIEQHPEERDEREDGEKAKYRLDALDGVLRMLVAGAVEDGSTLAALAQGAANDRQERMRILPGRRSEEHTSELQSRLHLVCRLLLEK